MAGADSEIDAEEVEVFEGFFGKGAFSESLDPERLESTLEDRMEQVREQASTTQAMQVLRDLCLVARAGGHTTEAERAVLDRIALGLGVSPGFVCHSMDSELAPD